MRNLSQVVAIFCVCIAGSARAQDVPSGPPGQIIRLDSRDVHLLCEGSGTPAVVIEAGSSTPSSVWRPVQDTIAGFTRTCTYDRAGYGWSDPAGKPRSMNDRAAELRRVLTAANEQGPYVLVGHSYGGFLVRLFARTDPDAVAGVVLVDASEEENFFSREAQAKWDLVGQNIRQAQSKATTAAGIAFYDEVLDELASNWLVPVDERRRGGFGTLGDKPLVVIAHGKPFEGLDGFREATWRAGQERLAKLSTRGKLIVARNSDHNIHFSEPDVIVEAVREVVMSARTAPP